MTLARLPLRGIAVFEAVGRLGSFKEAAAELNLTPSAVSHQIRALERELGIELFVRQGHGVSLSLVAAEFSVQVGMHLAGIRAATDAVSARAKVTTGTVRIMTPPSLATHWLMPRLPGFIEATPGVDIRVFAIRMADGRAEDFDISIGYGDAARWGGRAQPLLQEIVQPYCAPSRLQGEASMRPCDLLRQPLIRSGEGTSWENWFQERRVAVTPGAIDHLRIDPSYVAVEAAVNGIGVILESSLLTQEHVAAGRLVAPVSEEARPSVSYWLLPLRPASRKNVRIAYAWLLSQANVG